MVINDYFHALDSRKFALFDRVFTEDAVYEAQLVDGSVHRFEGRAAARAACEAGNIWRTSHHGVRNAGIEIDGDRATTNIYAMDALLDDRKLPGDISAGPRLIQHGLRYVDTLERRPEGWRITSRKLYCLWQNITASPAILDPLPEPR